MITVLKSRINLWIRSSYLYIVKWFGGGGPLPIWFDDFSHSNAHLSGWIIMGLSRRDVTGMMVCIWGIIPIAGLISSSARFSSRISQRPAGDDTGGCLTVLDSEVLVPQLLFAGFFIQAEQIPIWLRWAQYTCALKYGHLSVRREKMIWRGYAGSGK